MSIDPVTGDLHARLVAAVQRRLDVARAASYYRTTPEYVAGEVLAWAKANDPATIVRHCERDLRVLERHRPIANGPIGGEICDYDGGAYPCPDAEDLAAAYAVEVDRG